MTPYDDSAIAVNVEWNDWRPAHARLADLHDVHWHRPKGAPQPLLHAYVQCTQINGALAHAGQACSAPHHVRVCVLRSHNIPALYAELVRQTNRVAR